jgi:hypothetical protein
MNDGDCSISQVREVIRTEPEERQGEVPSRYPDAVCHSVVPTVVIRQVIQESLSRPIFIRRPDQTIYRTSALTRELVYEERAKVTGRSGEQDLPPVRAEAGIPGELDSIHFSSPIIVVGKRP